MKEVPDSPEKSFREPSVKLPLAREVPAPILADLVGCGANTAAKLAHELRVDWSGYAALRARRSDAG